MDSIELIPRPTPLPTGMAGWLETFTESFLKPFAPAERGKVLEEVVDLLRPTLGDSRGN